MKRKIIYISSIIVFSIILIITRYNLNNDAGIVYGDTNAPIEMINYTSFQCASCANLHKELGETIKKYIDSGDIKYIEKQVDIKRFEFDDVIYKHLNNNQISNFEELSKIYELQHEWGSLKSEKEVIDFFNLSKDENKKNLKDINKILKEKNKLEIKEVPIVYINGEQIKSNISKEEFENMIIEIKNS